SRPGRRRGEHRREERRRGGYPRWRRRGRLSRGGPGALAAGDGRAAQARRSPGAAMEDPLRIDIPKILEILPRRSPLLLVDRVTAIDPGKNIKGHKMVSYNEPWAGGHFPAQPILPGVLILEALAQLGAILAYVTEPFDPSSNV